MKVKLTEVVFTETVTVDAVGGETYKKGVRYKLPEPSVVRWVRRGKAVLTQDYDKALGQRDDDGDEGDDDGDGAQRVDELVARHRRAGAESGRRCLLGDEARCAGVEGGEDVGLANLGLEGVGAHAYDAASGLVGGVPRRLVTPPTPT